MTRSKISFMGLRRAQSSGVSPMIREAKPWAGRPRYEFGYTLIEVLVVAVIIVLMLGMALPLFRAITGSRSEAGAANLIAAVLSKARSDAIGLQKPIGVAIMYNPAKQVTDLGEVEFPNCSAWSTGITYTPGTYVSYLETSGADSGFTDYFLCIATQSSTTVTFPGSGTYWLQLGGPPIDLRPDTDVLALPPGIGIQTVCNTTTNSSGVRQNDGYLKLGVILFDGYGRLTSQNYGISIKSRLATAASLNANYPAVPNSGTGTPSVPICYPPPPISKNEGVVSQYGLVVYQRDAFASQNFPTYDVTYTTENDQQTGTYTSTSNNFIQEETWLDQNATPLVINRYTGTLVKGE